MAAKLPAGPASAQPQPLAEASSLEPASEAPPAAASTPELPAHAPAEPMPAIPDLPISAETERALAPAPAPVPAREPAVAAVPPDAPFGQVPPEPHLPEPAPSPASEVAPPTASVEPSPHAWEQPPADAGEGAAGEPDEPASPDASLRPAWAAPDAFPVAPGQEEAAPDGAAPERESPAQEGAADEASLPAPAPPFPSPPPGPGDSGAASLAAAALHEEPVPQAEDQAAAPAETGPDPTPPRWSFTPGSGARGPTPPAPPAAWAPLAQSLPVPADAAQRPPAPRRALRYIGLAVRTTALAVAGLIVAVLALTVLYRWVNPPISTLMIGRSLAGTEIERTWRPLERISPHLMRAVILSEDGGFCRHRGVDWAAIEEAIETDRGGSTITMQVVKNLFLWPSRSYVRKAIELGLAYLVEALWPKRRILEIYLNIAEWGDGVFGAEAAAQVHFGKRAAQLTADEAALLAAVLPNPIERAAGAPSEVTARIASRLATRMRTARADFSCVPVPRLEPRKAPQREPARSPQRLPERYPERFPDKPPLVQGPRMAL